MYKLSVIIPAYNVAGSIEKCISSIPDNVEIVVVDDGSSDGTEKIIEESLLNNPNIVLVKQNNSGVSAARNHGLEVASGDYIAFIDADDTVDTKKMQECMISIYNNPDIDMLVYGISFDYYRNNNCFRTLVMTPPIEGKKSIQECLDSINELFDANCLSSLCTRIIKRELISDIKLLEDMFLYEDLEFSLRVLARCSAVYFCKETVYHYRQDDNHVSNRIRQVNEMHEIIDRIDDALSELNCDKTHIVSSLSMLLQSQRINSLSYKELKEEYPDKVNRLYFKRIYISLRHSIAEYIKYHIWLMKNRNKIGV